MTETTRGPLIRREVREPIEELDGGLAVSPSDIGERLWHFFISMRTGLALILALAVLGLIGTVLVQAPAGLKGDAEAYAVWLESVRPKYGGWTTVFDALGLFSIFSSIWFRGITVLLMTSVLACSANRAPHLWRLTTRPRMRMSEGFFTHAPLSVSMVVATSPSQAAEAVTEALRVRRFRTLVEHDDQTIHVYADHNRWAPFGTVIAHLSLVVILVGALMGATFGFRDEGLAVAVGSSADVGYGTGMTVTAARFADAYYANGSPSDYASDLVVSRGGQEIAAATIRVNQPLRVGDVTFYQSYFGAAAELRVADAAGRDLFASGVPLEWRSRDDRHVVGQIVLPEADRTIYVIAPASGEVDPAIKPGQIRVEMFRTGSEATPLATAVLTQGEPAELDGLAMTFVRERQFTGLIVAKDPGVLFIWLGCFCLIAGIALVFFFPTRRIWALIRREGAGSVIHIGAVVRHDVGFESQFTTFSQGIQDTLASSGAKR